MFIVIIIPIVLLYIIAITLSIVIIRFWEDLVNTTGPHENNLLGNGGISVKVSCIPVGDYDKYKITYYKQDTDDEGNFTYPQIP